MGEKLWFLFPEDTKAKRAESFPPDVRYSGVSLGYQVGAILGGGIAPFVNVYLGGEDVRTALLLSINCAAAGLGATG